MARNHIASKSYSLVRAVEVIGDRWSILLVGEAYRGVARFDEFQLCMGVATNILSTRLKKLIDAGVIKRVPLPEHSRRYEYVLTNMGRDLFPTYLALERWGRNWLTGRAGRKGMTRNREEKIIVDSDVLSARQSAANSKRRSRPSRSQCEKI